MNSGLTYKYKQMHAAMVAPGVVRVLLWLCASWVLLLLASCKPSLPKGVLSESKMTDVLYDYHLAQGVLQEEGKDSEVDKQAYKLAVLKKYGITKPTYSASISTILRSGLSNKATTLTEAAPLE